MNAPNAEIKRIQQTTLAVLKNPAGFFETMPVSGGFADPVVFLADMGIIAGIIQAMLSVLGIGPAVSFFMALTAILIMPVFVVIFSFIAAGIFFVVWKLMGSAQTYEAAYRCVAYASAIAPVMILIGAVPYLGAVAGLLWMLYLMVMASEKVHKIEVKKAWMVFGVIFAILIIFNVNSQRMTRQTQDQVDEFNRRMQNMENMTPEEMGKAMGEFFKGMEAGSKE